MYLEINDDILHHVNELTNEMFRVNCDYIKSKQYDITILKNPLTKMIEPLILKETPTSIEIRYRNEIGQLLYKTFKTPDDKLIKDILNS